MKKILIIRLSSIGDIVLTTPVIRCLKNQLPDVELHYLTKKSNISFLNPNPYLDKIHLFEDNFNETIDKLKNESFDFVVDLHKNIRSIRVRKALNVPFSTFDKLNVKKWLLVNFKYDNMPDIHIVDRYMEAVKELGVTNDNKGLDYFIPEQDEVSINTLPDNFHSGYIGIVIGGAHKTKVFPEVKLIELVNKLDKPVILLGGPNDAKMGQNIISATNNPNQIYNSCGKYSINQSASLVKQASAIITNDTGLMHIASAFNKKIISIWGNTVPEFGMYPYLPQEDHHSMIVEIKGLKCRPCSKIGYNSCPKDHFKCMMDIDIDRIIEKL